MEKQSPLEFLYLSQEDVKAAGLNMKLAIEAVEESFKLHARNQIILPPKTVLDLNERKRGRVNAMPAYVNGDIDVCGIKWIAGFPQNPVKYGLPRAIGITILNDSHKGVPLVIMDGTLISAMRTGAATGVGAKYLARKDSETIAIIGSSVQAKTQLMALHEVLQNIKLVKVYSRSRESRELYAKEMSTLLNLNVVPVDSAELAVKNADVIVTATTADEPIVKNAWIKPGSFFSHIGSYQEEEYEVVLNSDKIVVDDWEQVEHRGTPILAKMYKEGLIKREDIFANLGEIVIGKKPGRENNDERIFFLPIGMGSEDIVVAKKIYENALKKGIGIKLKLWIKPELF
jgi:ornithine cyclodeaminase